MKLRKTWNSVFKMISVIQKEHKSIWWLLVIGPVTSALIPYIQLVYSAKILDAVFVKQFETCIPYIGSMLILTLILGMISRACIQGFNGIRLVVDETVEQQTVNKAYRMEYEEFENTETLEAIRRVKEGAIGSGGVSSQLNSVYRFIEGVASSIGAMIFVIALFCQVKKGQKVFWNSYGSTAVLILIYSLCFWVCMRMAQVSKKKFNHMQRENEHYNSVGSYLCNLFMNQAHGKEIRLYIMQQFCMEQFHKYQKKGVDMYLKWGEMDGRYMGIISLLSQVSAGISYVFIGAKAIYGVIHIGEVVMYAGAVNRLVEALQQMISEFISIEYRMEYLKIYEEFIHRPNMHYDGTLPIEKRTDSRYELEFQDVSFLYPHTETYVLKHVNLKFHIGDKMAIVGRNGAGKSTLIKLLCRLYEPTEGKILLNGIDIGLYDYREYVDIFSVVFQDFKIYSFPVGENISGSETLDEKQAWNVLREVGLKERIEAMPEKLGTQLYKNNGEGVELSGGEAQKLAIARALYKDGPFIILDEPAAALDPFSEAEIYENFNEMIHGKTAIYISHRMSSCKFCDDIVVLDEGCITERGSHEQLISLGGVYAELYQTQAKYYEEKGVISSPNFV